MRDKWTSRWEERGDRAAEPSIYEVCGFKVGILQLVRRAKASRRRVELFGRALRVACDGACRKVGDAVLRSH